MKKTNIKILFLALIVSLTSCAPQIELSSSWSNKQAKPKASPKVLVMVMGKDLAVRQLVEQYMVEEFKKAGHNAIAALDVFKPDVQKYDSVTMVTLLRQNKVDMLLTNAVVNVTEQERYVPGTTEYVAVGTYATPYNPYYSHNYNNFYSNYNNYNYSSMNYATQYETHSTPGYTVTDVEVIIESNLYDVSIPELLWFGQSKAYQKEPTTEILNAFAKIVVGDINKSNLLVK
jgi:hypothetical protein